MWYLCCYTLVLLLVLVALLLVVVVFVMPCTKCNVANVFCKWPFICASALFVSRVRLRAMLLAMPCFCATVDSCSCVLFAPASWCFCRLTHKIQEPALEICCGAGSDRHREKETVNMGQKEARRDDLHGATEVPVPDVRNMTFPLMEPIRIPMERASPFLILKRFQRPVSLRFGFTLCETS